jgi:hypothetical protein
MEYWLRSQRRGETMTVQEWAIIVATAVINDVPRLPGLTSSHHHSLIGERTMHQLAVEAIIRSVQKRVAQGDCPTEPAHSIETLEEVIIELANARLRRQIERDPDDEPSAGPDPFDLAAALTGKCATNGE